jgi:hypothetical protein
MKGCAGPKSSPHTGQITRLLSIVYKPSLSKVFPPFDAGVKNLTPATVIGADGKQYPATN